MQIALKLTKDLINQIAVPVSLNKALLIKVMTPMRLPRPLWGLYVNIVIVLQNIKKREAWLVLEMKFLHMHPYDGFVTIPY